MSIADDAQRAVEDGSDEGILDGARLVLEIAQVNIPVGDPEEDPDPAVSLAASGRIERDGDGWIVIFDTPYAAKVHEAQRYRHPRGGGAKYLERALTTVVPALEGIVASEVQQRFGRGL